MKKFLQTVTSFLVAFAMVAAPVADAQTRGRQSNGSTTSQSHSEKRAPSRSSRPSDNGNPRPSSSGHARPGNKGNGSQRPSGNHGNNGVGNNNHRPGQGNNRPSGDHGNNRPDNHRPGAGNHRPGFNPGHNGHHRPPRRHDVHYRHPVPFFGHYSRPVPPPRWHYHGGGPSFGTILGITLGTAIGVSINSLINNGYTVSSYGNDVVYLNNVPQMNYYWPDAALYYNNGMLYGSQFTYPSAYYDISRYNSLYNVLTSQYGMPVQTVNQGGVMSATWYGAANRYVILSFSSQYGGNYYTTLSFGN